MKKLDPKKYPKATAVKPPKSVKSCDICNKKSKSLFWAGMTSVLVCSDDCANTVERRIQEDMERSREAREEGYYYND